MPILSASCTPPRQVAHHLTHTPRQHPQPMHKLAKPHRPQTRTELGRLGWGLPVARGTILPLASVRNSTCWAAARGSASADSSCDESVLVRIVADTSGRTSGRAPGAAPGAAFGGLDRAFTNWSCSSCRAGPPPASAHDPVATQAPSYGRERDRRDHTRREGGREGHTGGNLHTRGQERVLGGG
eukprot:757735-Rhodomonas_salina.3